MSERRSSSSSAKSAPPCRASLASSPSELAAAAAAASVAEAMETVNAAAAAVVAGGRCLPGKSQPSLTPLLVALLTPSAEPPPICPDAPPPSRSHSRAGSRDLSVSSATTTVHATCKTSSSSSAVQCGDDHDLASTASSASSASSGSGSVSFPERASDSTIVVQAAALCALRDVCTHSVGAAAVCESGGIEAICRLCVPGAGTHPAVRDLAARVLLALSTHDAIAAVLLRSTEPDPTRAPLHALANRAATLTFHSCVHKTFFSPHALWLASRCSGAHPPCWRQRHPHPNPRRDRDTRASK